MHDGCPHCGFDFGWCEGNTWAFMYLSTAFLTGLFVVGLLLIRPQNVWIGRVVVLPLALLAITGTLPFRKGLAIAIEYLVERRFGTAIPPEEPSEASRRNQP